MKCAYCTRRSDAQFMSLPLCSACLHAFIAGLMLGHSRSISDVLLPVCRDCVTMKKVIK
jgi:hypothetical protein